MADRQKPHVMVFIGTRPEAVKMAPIITELRHQTDAVRCTVVSTGQHREMLQQALASFQLDADIDLAIMRPSQTLAGLTSAVIEASDRVLSEQRPDVVLVQGDTTTVVAASMAAYYQRIAVGHVEAGLRTGDRYNPFPEEMNRSLLAPLASYHFAPTTGAAENLRREGVPDHRIHVTGNTVVDALETLRAGLDESNISPHVREAADKASGRLILVTCHRRESFGRDLEIILSALRALAARFPERLFFFPVHLNPAVRQQVLPQLGGIPNIILADPIPYQDMLFCLSKAELVLTDSGGLQEETPSFHVPCLVLRRTTERPEGVSAGFAKLVPLEEDELFDTAADWIAHNKRDHLKGLSNPYGDGKAAARIVSILMQDLSA